MRFRDRRDAGRHLADALGGVDLRGLGAVVLGLPRGGVPVAFEVSERFGFPLDVLVVRKLGVPFQPELAMGAIGEGAVRVENLDVLRSTGLTSVDLDDAEQRERPELERRASRYRAGRTPVDLHDRCAIVVDDGIATGSSARAACKVVRALGAARIVVATPVASRLAAAELRADCDELVCLELPEPFFAVGEWYHDFSQTTDQEVIDLLRRAASDRAGSAVAAVSDGCVEQSDDDIEIPLGSVTLAGRLTIPPAACATVIFAHGSGSGRHSPRNRFVASELQRAGLATLLLDLLTPDEEVRQASVFDVQLLGQRLEGTTRWAGTLLELAQRPFGYFGESTGAAAALWAAAQPDCRVAALVSRGGRPDLAAPLLSAVRAPTLLIVGARDEIVLELNRKAQAALRCESRLSVVPGASHLFEEAGTLDVVAELARDWFITNLGMKEHCD